MSPELIVDLIKTVSYVVLSSVALFFTVVLIRSGVAKLSSIKYKDIEVQIDNKFDRHNHTQSIIRVITNKTIMECRDNLTICSGKKNGFMKCICPLQMKELYEAFSDILNLAILENHFKEVLRDKNIADYVKEKVKMVHSAYDDKVAYIHRIYQEQHCVEDPSVKIVLWSEIEPQMIEIICDWATELKTELDIKK